MILEQFIQWLPTLCDCDEAVAWRKKQEELEECRQEEERIAYERLKKIERIKKLFGSSGIKKRLKTRTFSTFQETDENTHALRTSKQFVSDFDEYLDKGIGLYFEGPSGTGKTHLAVAIALNLLKKGVPVVFCTFGELLAELRKTHNPKSAVTEDQIMSVYLSADLLIIDDLGKEKPSEWTLDRLYYIINARYEDMKPTIITANYNREDLVKRLNHKGGDGNTAKAIISRLQETTGIITMDGENWRLNSKN